jgi:transglutaminase-like putative cysteine protease
VRELPWFTALGSGVAVLLASAPVSAVVQGPSWVGGVVGVVLAVVATGLMLHRAGPLVVAAGQAAVVVMIVTATYTDQGIFRLLPGPAAMNAFGALITGAGQQIDAGLAPVAATPEILFLVTTTFGLLAIGIYLAAVGASAPAAAGVPMLALFAVPAALAPDLLPGWTMVSAGLGFGVLLVARDGARRQIVGGTVLVAIAIAAALAVGSVTGFVGTAGRSEGGAGAGGPSGSIGLNPFTALRGQLEQTTPTELFRVRGMPNPTYIRALTLRDFIPASGWQATRPDPGPALPGPTGVGPGAPGALVDVQIENVAFRDYWLPLLGVPVEVGGVSQGLWTYDARSSTAYTGRPRQEDAWQERTLLPSPTAQQLREAKGEASPGPDYLNVQGLDPRVTALAQQVVQGRATAFDKTMALQDFFTGPGSPFTYSLRTAPGGGDDALVEFLTVGRSGYCEQYASAMAVMLRAIGVPARVAVGFTAGSDSGDYRSVSTADAHAWVEAWFPDIGWTTFDPTPLADGRTVTPPYVAEARADGSSGNQPIPETQQGQDEQPAPTPSAEPTPAPSVPQEAAPPPPQSSGVPLWPFVTVLVVALLVGVALIPAGLRARERKRRLAAASAGGPEAASAGWAELLAESTDRGAPSPPTDTVRAAARRLVREHRLGEEPQQALRHLVATVEASWYGDGHPAPGTLDAPLRDVQAGIAEGSPLSLGERLLPRSMRPRRMGRRVKAPGNDDAARD